MKAFEKLEKYIKDNNNMNGYIGMDLDIYHNEKRAVLYMIESSNVIEIYSLNDGGYYCVARTELEERTLHKKKVKNDNKLIELIDYYQDIMICDKIKIVA